EFTAVLVKGRRNYLSLRRLELAMARSKNPFDRDEDFVELRQINSWSKDTLDGSLSDLNQQPAGHVWDEVASDNTNCMGRRCPTYKKCFYYQDRRRVQNAQILVVNHALLFSDIALRRAGVSILPDYDVVILDEAHTVESVAGDHLGIRITNGQVEYILNKLYNDRTQKGLFIHHGLKQLQQRVDQCRYLADEFFGNLWEWREANSSSNGRVAEPNLVASPLSAELSALAKQVKAAGANISEETEQQDFLSAHDRLAGLAGEIEAWRAQSLVGGVYWIETGKSRRGRPRLTLAAAPIDVGPALREQLFDKLSTVVMTSATLSIGRPSSNPSPASGRGKGRGFEFFQSRIGLTQCRTLQLGGPFNYKEQAALVTLRDMPDPGDAQDYLHKCVDWIKHFVAETDGRTFVLFTSYDMLRRAASSLQPWLTSQNLRLLSQADGTPRTKM
ncbi:MAG: helicase, partial [Pirellulaceae bacterium]